MKPQRELVSFDLMGTEGGRAMGEWTKVVTNPLGLAGFALFLMFTILARQKRKSPGMQWALYAAACVALVGGLMSAYRSVGNQAQAPKTQQMQIGSIKQSSKGDGAVNASGVQGDINQGNPKAEEVRDQTKRKAKQ